MRSTVSIVFVLNIDEIVFHACSSVNLKSAVKDTTFQVRERLCVRERVCVYREALSKTLPFRCVGVCV